MTNPVPTTVMVVEDDSSASAGLMAALSHYGFLVVSVGNGRIALDQLESGNPPDVILLDLVMPEMDGWQFLSRIKETSAAAVPVIVTTGAGLTRESVTARGAAGFLHKPYTLEDLVAELHRVIGPLEPTD